METCLNKIKRPVPAQAEMHRRKSRCNTMAVLHCLTSGLCTMTCTAQVGDLKPPGPARGKFRERVGSSTGQSAGVRARYS